MPRHILVLGQSSIELAMCRTIQPKASRTTVFVPLIGIEESKSLVFGFLWQFEHERDLPVSLGQVHSISETNPVCRSGLANPKSHRDGHRH